MPSDATLPAEIGLAEIRSIFNLLDKETSTREKDLGDAARQIMLDEELLDALYVKFEELDTDFHRTEYAAESTFDKLKLFTDRTEEIIGEVAAVETELPLLSSTISRFPTTKGGAVSAQDIFLQLERQSQQQAFLAEELRRLQARADPAWIHNAEDPEGSSWTSHQKVKRQPVDPILLKISEGKVLQDNLEWELAEIEERLMSLGMKRTERQNDRVG